MFNSLLIFKTEVEQGRGNDTEFLIFADKAVSDLREGDGGDHPSLQEKIFNFSQQKRTKMNFDHLERFLKNDFCRSSPLPSKILDPPLIPGCLSFSS